MNPLQFVVSTGRCNARPRRSGGLDHRSRRRLAYAAFVLCAAAALLPDSASRADALHIYTWREDTAGMVPGASSMIWVRARYGSDKKPIGASWQSELTRNFWSRLMFPKMAEHGDLEHGETTVYGRGDHPQAA